MVFKSTIADSNTGLAVTEGAVVQSNLLCRSTPWSWSAVGKFSLTTREWIRESPAAIGCSRLRTMPLWDHCNSSGMSPWYVPVYKFQGQTGQSQGQDTEASKRGKHFVPLRQNIRTQRVSLLVNCFSLWRSYWTWCRFGFQAVTSKAVSFVNFHIFLVSRLSQVVHPVHTSPQPLPISAAGNELKRNFHQIKISFLQQDP